MADAMRVYVFFYGSYINFDVLKEVDYTPEQWEVARLGGFELRIEPHANLVRSDRHCVYGIVATATHAELARLYAHAQGTFGHTYLPEAVLVETLEGKFRPALSYICHEMHKEPADPAYVERIAGPARRFGFPDWYIETIERFGKREPTARHD